MTYTWYELALLIAGAATALRVGTGFLLSLYSGLRCFVLPKLGLGIDLRRKFGKWAVVTGATDGIGKAYATNLASRGINVVLVSRSQEKLDAVAKEIEAAHQEIKTRVVCADFSARSQSLYDQIASQIEDLDIGILVNNVGVAYDHPDYFHELSPEKMWQLMIVNMASVTLMTRALLPRLISQRRGLIINVSSFSGTRPQPLLAVYSAAKAFADTLTQSLIGEYGHHEGIMIQSVRPLFVATNMTKMKPSFFVPTAKCFARDALGTVGVVDVTTGCMPHSIQSFAADLVPRALFSRMIWTILNRGRERALRRKKRSD